MPSILFVCIHNACRSQIAGAICKKLAPDSWTVASAGIRPSLGVDPKAAQILARWGLTMAEPKPMGFTELPAASWDYLVDISCLSVPPIAAPLRRASGDARPVRDGSPAVLGGTTDPPEAGAPVSHLPVVARKVFQWDIADPMDGPMDLYQALYDELKNRVSKLIEEIGAPHP